MVSIADGCLKSAQGFFLPYPFHNRRRVSGDRTQVTEIITEKRSVLTVCAHIPNLTPCIVA
jgi:hypothetical protein